MIRLENVSYIYPHKTKPALKNVTLDIKKGEFLGIVGRNGSGKSTLAQLLNGMIVPNFGQVIVDDLNTRSKLEQIKIRQKVGLLLPSPDNQIIFNIVEEDVAFGPENLGWSSSEIRYRVDLALKMVLMEEFKKHPPYLLSGGQKQKVALAGLIAMNPQYLVLDEPTSMLDFQAQAELIETILNIKKETNMSIIMITHDLSEIKNADKILILDDGVIKRIIKPEELYQYTDELETYGIEQLDLINFTSQLKKQGVVNLTDGLLTVDDLVNELCRLK
ncbi:MAG TPA: energy-coupling factor transporter ATPase [Syntrophomonadaceae bacterium]|nr:energy-coupling factor transporter ATPase [Syntrophomonadaceae bacterium]